MNRARKLLKACNQLNNTPETIISQILSVVMLILIAVCLFNNLYGLALGSFSQRDEVNNLSMLSMIIVILCIRSIYTGFFEDKRQGTKNNLKALTMHLPVNKKDFILAQYMEMLYLYIPVGMLIIFLLGLNFVRPHTRWYLFLSGEIILLFSVTYCLISLEKGLLIYYYIDPRIRELLYLVLTFIWLGINYLVGNDKQKLLEQIAGIHYGTWFTNGISHLSYWGGFICLTAAVAGGYILSVRLPLMIERRRS